MRQDSGIAPPRFAFSDAGPGPRSRRRVQVLLTVAGLALTLGLLVYLIDRGTTHAQGLPALALPALGSGLHLFGAWGDWLPSAAHTLAFSLLTAAALPQRRVLAYGACAAWCAIDLGFEIGQHPQVAAALAGALQEAGGRSAPVMALSNYFVRGRFDAGDLAATVAGALLAALVLRCVHIRPEVDHEG